MPPQARFARVTTVVIPLAVAVSVLVATALMADLVSSASELEREQQIAAIAEAKADSLEGALERHVATVEALAAFVATTSYDSEHVGAEFAPFAAELFDASDATQALQVVEGTVITQVYPVEGNREAIGLDLTDRSERRGLIEASMRSGRTVLEGPIELVQGGTGLVIRKPISTDDGVFWGFGAAVVDWEAIPAVAAFGTDDAITVGLRAVSDGRLLAGSSEAFEGDGVARIIATGSLGPVWELSIADRSASNGSSAIVWVLGGIGAILAGLYLRSILRRPEILARERELAYREAAEAEARYQAIFEHAGVGMAIADQHGRLVHRNEVFDEVFDVAGADSELRTIDLLHHSEIPAYLGLVAGDFAVGESYELDFRSRSEPEQWVWTHVTRIPDAGEDERYLGIVEDVTQSRRMAAALEESERRFRELFEKTPVAVQREDHTETAAMIHALEAQGIEDIESYLLEHRDLLEEMVSGIRLLDANPAARS